MRPLLGISSPATQRSVVVLPQPEGPSSDKNSPWATSRSSSATAAVSVYNFASCRMIRRDKLWLSSRHPIPTLDDRGPLLVRRDPIEGDDLVEVIGGQRLLIGRQ